MKNNYPAEYQQHQELIAIAEIKNDIKWKIIKINKRKITATICRFFMANDLIFLKRILK